MVPAGAGEGGEPARAHPTGTPRSPLLTQQQEAEHPLQNGEELEPGADVPLRGPGCCEQGAQGGLDAGAAACGEGHGTQSKTARVVQTLSQLAGGTRSGGTRVCWGGGMGARQEVGWEG